MTTDPQPEDEAEQREHERQQTRDEWLSRVEMSELIAVRGLWTGADETALEDMIEYRRKNPDR